MTDARRRQRSRKAASGLDVFEAEVLRLVEDTRAGALDPRFVALAAVLGDPAARAAYPAWERFAQTELNIGTCEMAPGFHYEDGLCEALNWLWWSEEPASRQVVNDLYELSLTRIQRIGRLWDVSEAFLDGLVEFLRGHQHGYAADWFHGVQRARQNLLERSQALLDERSDETMDLIGLLLNRAT